MKQYHRIILAALEKFGDDVAAHDDTHDVWLDSYDLRHLATQACEAAYESICLSSSPRPWLGYAHILKSRRAMVGGDWYTIVTFEPNQRCGLPRLSLYVP